MEINPKKKDEEKMRPDLMEEPQFNEIDAEIYNRIMTKDKDDERSIQVNEMLKMVLKHYKKGEHDNITLKEFRDYLTKFRLNH